MGSYYLKMQGRTNCHYGSKYKKTQFYHWSDLGLFCLVVNTDKLGSRIQEIEDDRAALAKYIHSFINQ